MFYASCCARNWPLHCFMCDMVWFCMYSHGFLWMFCLLLHFFYAFSMFLTVFTRFWEFFVYFCALGAHWGACKPFLAPLKLSWDGLGCSWGGLGAPLGGSCGHLRPILQKKLEKIKKNTKKTRNFGGNLGGKMERKSWKIDVKSQHVCRLVF